MKKYLILHIISLCLYSLLLCVFLVTESGLLFKGGSGAFLGFLFSPLVILFCIIFAIFIVLNIIGCCKYRKVSYKRYHIISLIITLGVIGLPIILWLVVNLAALPFATMQSIDNNSNRYYPTTMYAENINADNIEDKYKFSIFEYNDDFYKECGFSDRDNILHYGYVFDVPNNTVYLSVRRYGIDKNGQYYFNHKNEEDYEYKFVEAPHDEKYRNQCEEIWDLFFKDHETVIHNPAPTNCQAEGLYNVLSEKPSIRGVFTLEDLY